MNIPNVEIGKRLRVARENASITQMKAASLIGVARTTVVAIEKGDREIHIDELQILAKAYNVSSNEILRNETISINILPSFRKSNDTKDNDVYVSLFLYTNFENNSNILITPARVIDGEKLVKNI